MIGAPPTYQTAWTPVITVRVYGTPKGQPRPRAFAKRFGNKFAARVFDPGPAEGWKSCVAAAFASHRSAPAIDGAIRCDIIYLMPRPKRLCRKSDLDGRMLCIDKPDLDNMDKAVLDAITQLGIWGDDKQVCGGERWKYYAARDERPGCEIIIYTRN